jgi:integrase
VRAYETDLGYITAWKLLSFRTDLSWPESEDVALRFLLDHARDIKSDPPDSAARVVAEVMIERGLRKTLSCPAPSTLDRRIASWRAFHRMRNLPSPFESPLLRDARSKARRAAARPAARKSANPVTRDVLEALLTACGSDLRGLRDRAILCLGWASGGRRRSEISELDLDDLDRSSFAETGAIRFTMRGSKTTTTGKTPSLILQGRAAWIVEAWIVESRLTNGPLFRPMSKAGKVLSRRLSPDGVASILKARLADAGFEDGFATPHGLRSGFLTQAALDGAPLQAAMRLSLHRSVPQAMAYYDEVEIAENPATKLLD